MKIKKISNLNINSVQFDGTNDIQININSNFEDNTIQYEEEKDIECLSVKYDNLFFNTSRIRSKSFIINLKSASEILLTGVGNIHGDIKTEEISLVNKGVGNMKFSGRANKINATSRGVGNINLKELLVDYANLNLYGVGDIIANVQQNGNFVNSGVGDMTIHGEPMYQKISNSVGEIKFKKNKNSGSIPSLADFLRNDKKTKYDYDYNDYYNEHVINKKNLNEYKNDLNKSLKSNKTKVVKSEDIQNNVLKDISEEPIESPETRLKNKIRKIL